MTRVKWAVSEVQRWFVFYGGSVSAALHELAQYFTFMPSPDLCPTELGMLSLLESPRHGSSNIFERGIERRKREEQRNTFVQFRLAQRPAG